MNNLKKIAASLVTSAALIVGLCSLASCAQPIASSTKTSSSSTATGSLTISVPAIAPWIEQATAAKDASTAAKAIAFTTSAKVEILDPNNGNANVVDPVTVSTSSSLYSGSTPSTSISVSAIPVGGPYTVRLSLYNSTVSTSTPTLIGTASSVAVAKGATTSVTIYSLPQSASSLALDANASPSLVFRAEAWYSVPVSASTKYYLTQSNPNLVMAAFGSNGNYITSGSTYLECTTGSSDSSIYVVVGNNYYNSGSTTAQSGTLKVSASEPVLNEGSTSSPASLTLNADHVYAIGPYSSSQNSSYYSFVTTSAGDYVLDTSSNTNTYYNAFLYSDSSFTMQTQYFYGYHGFVMRGLAASTTYYLKLWNGSSNVASFSGTLYDPSNTFSLSSDGTLASPSVTGHDNQPLFRVIGSA